LEWAAAWRSAASETQRGIVTQRQSETQRHAKTHFCPGQRDCLLILLLDITSLFAFFVLFLFACLASLWSEVAEAFM
jgi:hypothetical protein